MQGVKNLLLKEKDDLGSIFRYSEIRIPTSNSLSYFLGTKVILMISVSSVHVIVQQIT